MTETYDPIPRLSELIDGIDCAILTTIRPDGTLHSCPMTSQGVAPEGVIWFLSDSHTEKVEAVRTNQRVNVAFADPATQRYVSISGFCELVRDHNRIKALWTPAYAAWYPGGPDDANLLFLKIDVQQVEYWDSAARNMVALPGFQPRAIL